jgi:hypothetical protein
LFSSFFYLLGQESLSQSSFDDEEAAEKLWTWKKNVPLLYDVMYVIIAPMVV